MKRREQAQWLVAGTVAAPVDRVWWALIEGNADLSPEDKAAIVAGNGPDPLRRSIAQPYGGKLYLEVSGRQHTVATQGEWWFRGVYSVETDEQGSRLIYQVFNIAPGVGGWAAQLIQGPQHARTMRSQLRDQLRSIGTRLGCAFHLEAA